MIALTWLACGGPLTLPAAHSPGAEDTGSAPRADPPTSLVMISLDTLRVGDLGFFGGGAVTPELDAFLGDAEVWTDHQTCSNWTFSAVTCVMSASWPAEIDFVPQAFEDEMGEVPDEVVLGPEVLQAAGFATRLVTTSPFLHENTLLDSGFDEVTDLVTGGHVTTAASVTDEALAALEALPADQPSYLHAHYIDPHQGYTPPAEYLGGLADLDEIPWDLDEPWSNEQIVEAWPTLSDDERALARAHLDVRYQGELAYLSAEVGRLLEALPSDTLVVIWSDHGEELLEHGQLGHQLHLFEQSTHALVALRWAGGAARQVTGRTHHQQIWPTVLDLLQIDRAGLLGEHRDAEPELRFAQKLSEDGSAAMVEDGDFKLVVYDDGTAGLYELPDERVDVLAERPAAAAALWQELGPFVEHLDGLSLADFEDPGL